MPVDPPDMFLKKAEDDERLVLLIGDAAGASDEQVGFHAQQAVEKAIKSVLARRGVPFRRTHDIEELIELVDRASIPFPADLRASADLTPFAVQYRYDDLVEAGVEPADPFDRAGAAAHASAAVARARAVAGGA
jgi:HEPN domain-containing protein